jgi:4-alpha-glucanotransferase
LQNNESFGLEDEYDTEDLKQIIERDFDEKLAECILFASSSCNSVWFIPPLQDLLFMQKKYWHEKCEEERINVPGTVNEFNWTYRMPISIDELLKDTKLIEKITAISKNRGGN